MRATTLLKTSKGLTIVLAASYLATSVRRTTKNATQTNNAVGNKHLTQTNGLVAACARRCVASLFVVMRTLAVLLFSGVAVSSLRVRVTHAVVPARGRPHFMQLHSPAPLENTGLVLPPVLHSSVNNTEPVLPPVVPLVVQQGVAVVTLTWLGYVGRTSCAHGLDA